MVAIKEKILQHAGSREERERKRERERERERGCNIELVGRECINQVLRYSGGNTQ